MKNEVNEDFLYGLRKEPSTKYLATLKADLERQVARQAKARRSLLRTAILAALMGGSVVAVAFVAWRGIPATFRSLVQNRVASDRRSESVTTIIPSIDGEGAARTGSLPSRELAPPGNAAQPTDAPQTGRSGATRTVTAIAGVAGIIADAENYVRRPVELGYMKRPELTQTNSAQAIAMLCRVRGSAGADSATADAAGTDRRMAASELATCTRNGVKRVTELRSGYEAVILARSKLYEAPKLSARDIFLALAAKVPDLPNRPYALIKNPYHVWNAIDPALSEDEIDVLGPPKSSTAALTLRQTLMEAGCMTFASLASLKERNPEGFDKVCHSIREDGAYKQTEANIGSHLDTYPNAMAVMTFKEATENSGFVAAAIDGVDPSRETVYAGTYGGSRLLFWYVNSGEVAGFRPLYEFLLGFQRSMAARYSDASLLALDPAQREAEIQKITTLPELVF